MIQVSPECASHVLAMNAEPDMKHLPGDRVRVLMNLPFLLLDLIKPEVRSALPKDIVYYIICFIRGAARCWCLKTVEGYKLQALRRRNQTVPLH